ncbi:hypothetical protein CES86_1690 [Brucella lupini]|uniref:Uncharacterized protein n=1 Tax=Brucella lupini TaxID=255457 RepID=A0A256GUE1_9HYPH|nr:hypothetical protein CES86_1690 [Brucella lupini]
MAARLKPERRAPDDPVDAPGRHRQKWQTAYDGIVFCILIDPCRRQARGVASNDPDAGETFREQICETFIQFDQG